MLIKTKGAILRSKVRWHEGGERNTKYFYSLEKRHHDIKTVSKLKVGENCYTEEQFEILEEEKKFYESLYRSTNINPEKFKKFAFFISENVTALSEAVRSSCGGVVNEEECTNALKVFCITHIFLTLKLGLCKRFNKHMLNDTCFTYRAYFCKG